MAKPPSGPMMLLLSEAPAHTEVERDLFQLSPPGEGSGCLFSFPVCGLCAAALVYCVLLVFGFLCPLEACSPSESTPGVGGSPRLAPPTALPEPRLPGSGENPTFNSFPGT